MTRLSPTRYASLVTVFVNIHEAKTHLSRLIERVLGGEEVVITRNKEPVVRLVRETPVRVGSRIGTMKGRLGASGDALLEPWSEEDLPMKAWEAREL